MREGQCALLFEDHYEVLTDNDTFIPVNAILLGMSEKMTAFAQSFVVILRDESELNQQMKQAEDAKAKK